MEALQINMTLSSRLTLQEALTIFFGKNDPELVQVLFWKMFQCWVTRECQLKSELTDEEIALVLDQLNDLVAAAYFAHQSTRAISQSQEEADNA